MVKTKLDDIKQKKLIRDPTLDFNKRLNIAPVMYDLKGLEKRNLVAFLQVKFFVENLHERERKK